MVGKRSQVGRTEPASTDATYRRRPEAVPDRVLALQRAAGNAAVSQLLGGRQLARLKIPDDVGVAGLDTADPGFADRIKGMDDPALLRRIARFLSANAGPAPTVDDRAAIKVVAERRSALGADTLDKNEAATETDVRALLDRVIAGTTTPERALEEAKDARKSVEAALTKVMTNQPGMRGVAIDMKKSLSTLLQDLISRLTTYAKVPPAARPSARDYFKEAKALTVGAPMHVGSEKERAAVRVRHAKLLAALVDAAKLGAEDVEYIIDSLLNPDHAADAAGFADDIVSTVPSWPAIKLAGLQEDLRKLKGDRAAWKGTAAELLYVHWEVQQGHVQTGKLVTLGSRKKLLDQAKDEVDQDVDVAFVDATDLARHYHEIKADPSALLSKGKTKGTVEGKQVEAYGRVGAFRQLTKKTPLKIRFVCVGTRGWTALYDQGVMHNIAKAGMELQLGPRHIYDAAALVQFAAKLKLFDEHGKPASQTLDEWERTTKRWPTPAEFEADFDYWNAHGSLPPRTGPSPVLLASPGGYVVGQKLTYTSGMAAKVTVLAIKDVPPKDAAPDPGPDDAVARIGDSVYVRTDGGLVLLAPLANLT